MKWCDKALKQNIYIKTKTKLWSNKKKFKSLGENILGKPTFWKPTPLSMTSSSLSIFPSSSSTANHFSQMKYHFWPVMRSRTAMRLKNQLGETPALLCQTWTFCMLPRDSGTLRVGVGGGGGEMRSTLLTPNYPKSIKIHHLVLFDFGGFITPQSSPANRACSHVYQIHQTPPAAFGGFRTVYSQAMDALHLLLYQFHQSPTIGVPFLSGMQLCNCQKTRKWLGTKTLYSVLQFSTALG